MGVRLGVGGGVEVGGAVERDGLGVVEGDAERDALGLGDAERDADGDGEADRLAFGLGEASGEPVGARLATGSDGFASNSAVSVVPGSEDPPSARASAVPPRATTVQAPARSRTSRLRFLGPPPPPVGRGAVPATGRPGAPPGVCGAGVPAVRGTGRRGIVWSDQACGGRGGTGMPYAGVS
ncbi:hypothetical protein ACQEVM_28040 [Streptomyces sp. CA-243310]|uniref:hypothetical protein n=1 Tax=Streptomyces sp. CA-243310 TaxID=3240056 RepID=UPI003D8C8D82